MGTDYFNTNDSDGDLGYFIGVVDSSIWSNADIESNGKADYDGSDRYQLYWGVSVLDILQDDFDDDVESTTVVMGIGKDWYPESNPDDIRHKDDPGDEAVESGNAKPILFSGATRKGSVYGKFLKGTRGGPLYETQEGTAITLDGGDEVEEFDLVKLGRWFQRNGITDARKASIWKDHVFLFRGLGLIYNRDQRPRLKALPVKWLGTREEYEQGTGLATHKPEGTSTPTSTVEVEQVIGHAAMKNYTFDPELAADITTVLNESSSHAVFMRNTLPMPEVKGDEKLTALITDAEGLWSLRS